MSWPIRCGSYRLQHPFTESVTRRVVRWLPTTPWSDRFVSLVYNIFMHRRIPRFRDPKRFSDRLLSLKLSGELLDPLRQFVSDKEYVKHYIASVVGSKYTLETYDILRTNQELDVFVLERVPCVIKPTHMSGEVLIYLARDVPPNRRMMDGWLNYNYYRRTREENYKNLKRKIIVEEFFSEDGCTPPNDYKIFCFHGCPRVIQVDFDRFHSHTRNLYDTKWNRLPITLQYPPGSREERKPRHLDVMLEIARELARPFSFIRVDMYANSSTAKVGELTNCPGSGVERIKPDVAEFWLGDLFDQDSRSPWSVVEGTA